MPDRIMAGAVSPQFQLTGCLFGSEAHPRLGIEFQAAQGAPAGECLRLHYRADDAGAFGCEFLFALVRFLQPLVVAPGQAVGIRHDRENFCVIGTLIPGHADGLQLGV